MRSLNLGEPAQPPASVRTGSFGRYDLCAKLGSGGQAEVYLALMHGQAGFNKLVVIKKLRGTEYDDPMRVSRFLDEARLSARLNHPNIVHTYEVGENEGEYFIAMEYLEGQPMNRLGRNPSARKHFTPAMWAKVASEALRGLGYAHNLTDYDGAPLGIVHRDISPDNLFLTYDGEIKIVDFGIAKALLNNEKTETGTLKGKVSYMAPEQVKGTVDSRADLFAMGVVLWGFFTGKKLFEGERGSVLYRLMTDPIPGLATEVPDVDPFLASIVDRALQKDPNHRFQTAEEMREALEEFIRASGDLVPDVTLGKVVRETFAETRQRVQRQIQAAISRTVPLSAGEAVTIELLAPRLPLPEIGSLTPSQDGVSWEGGPSTGSLSNRLQTSTSPPLTDPSSAPMPANRRRLVLLGAAGGAIVAITIAVVIALRTGKPTVAIAPPPAVLAPVEIISDPPGARVEMNGVALGHTPGRFDLAPGAHTLIVTMEAYKAEALVVEATASPTSHAVVLRPETAAAAPQPVPPPGNHAVTADHAPDADEVATANGPGVSAPAPPRRPVLRRVPPPPAPAPQHARTTAPSPKPKETAAPTAAIKGPRVKVIEDDPRQKIKVINE